MILDDRQPPNAGGPSTLYRLKRGTKASEMPPYPPPHAAPPLSSFNGPFQLAEYLALKVRLNPHDVEALVEIPQDEGGNGPTKAVWILEHLRRIPIDLTPLLVALIGSCTRETCPQMKADEWLYLCVAHGTNETEECCAIDYILHTVDSASATLNSTKLFPSRLSVPVASEYGFPSMCRRLCRIFSHAYFHHREIFSLAEAETSLYARFVALCERYDLVGGKLFVIPREVVRRRFGSDSHAADEEEGDDLGRGPVRGSTTRQLVDTESGNRIAEASGRDSTEEPEEEEDDDEEDEEEDDDAQGRSSRSLSSTEGKERRTQSLDRNPLPDLIDLSGAASGSKSRPDRKEPSATGTTSTAQEEGRDAPATAQKLDRGMTIRKGNKGVRSLWASPGSTGPSGDSLDAPNPDQSADEASAPAIPSLSATIRSGRSRSGSVVTAIHEADEEEAEERPPQTEDAEPPLQPQSGSEDQSETHQAKPQGETYAAAAAAAAVDTAPTEAEDARADVTDLDSAMNDIKISEEDAADAAEEDKNHSSTSHAPEQTDRQAAEVDRSADEAAPSNEPSLSPSTSAAEEPPTPSAAPAAASTPAAQQPQQQQPAPGKSGGKGNQGGKHKGAKSARNGKSPKKPQADGAAMPSTEANKSDDPDSPERREPAS